MKKKDLFVSLVLLIALVFSGCAAPGVAEAVNDLTNGEESQSSRALATGANWSVEYRTVSDWGTGFNGEIVISNKGKEPISDWTLSFDWKSELSSIWGGTLKSSANGHYVIVPPAWKNSIAPGASVKIGLNGRGPVVAPGPVNVNFDGTGVISTDGYESFDRFVANLRASYSRAYIVDITPLDGSSSYVVTIGLDPTQPVPTLLGLFAGCKFKFSRTKSNRVVVDAASFKSQYQGFPGRVDDALLLEGVRQLVGEEQLTSKTMGFFDDLLLRESSVDRILFTVKSERWLVRRTATGAIILTPAFWVNDVTHDEFMKGLKTKVGPGFMVRSIKVPTLLPPATWTVEVASIIDAIIPGRLEFLTCTIYEKDEYGHVAVTAGGVNATYVPLNGPQPEGSVLFTAMQLYLAQSGVKSFTEDDVIALMSNISMETVGIDGKKFTFGCPKGLKWVAYEENGKVVLKRV